MKTTRLNHLELVASQPELKKSDSENLGLEENPYAPYGIPWKWCEALTKMVAWRRTDEERQCSRAGFEEVQLAGAFLCRQHAELAERYGELEMTGGRTVVLEQEWSDDRWRRIITSARVVRNVSRFRDRSRF